MSVTRPISHGTARGHRRRWIESTVLTVAWAALMASGPIATGRSCGPPAGGNTPISGELETVLKRVRSAVGYDVLIGDPRHLRLTSRVGDASGIESISTLTFASDGRFCQQMTGPVERISGYDGETPWRVLWGSGSVLALAERELSLVGSWLRTCYWLDPRAPVTLELVPDGEQAEDLRIEMTLDDGLIPWVVSVDRTTWLPRSVTLRRAGRETIISFEEYLDQDGWKLPKRVSVHAYGRLIRASTVQSVVRLPAVSDQIYAPRIAYPEDTEFAEGASPRIEVRSEPGSNRLLIHPLINGKDVGWFLFDTGASGWVITREASRRAGLEVLTSTPSTGAAGRSIMLDTCRARSIRIGPATYKNQILRATDLPGIKPGTSGLIGHGLFARSVVEYDATTRTIAIHDPRRYELRSSSWQAMVPGQMVPTIRTSFEGHTALFRLDTGATSAVVFNSPCVKRLHLLADRQTREIEARGGDGSFSIRRGLIKWIELGGQRFESVEAEFSTMTKGVLADEQTAGIIGNHLLRSFTLVLDHPHSRIAFVPRI